MPHIEGTISKAEYVLLPSATLRRPPYHGLHDLPRDVRDNRSNERLFFPAVNVRQRRSMQRVGMMQQSVRPQMRNYLVNDLGHTEDW